MKRLMIVGASILAPAALVAAGVYSAPASPAHSLIETVSAPTVAADPYVRPPRRVILVVSRAEVRKSVAKSVAKPVVQPKKKPVSTKPKVYVSNVRGIQASAYTGSWYDARFEGTRRCIVQRESRGNYSVMNSGGYSGAYQFGQAWTKTIQKWTGEYVPIRYMSRAAQDYAFWRAFNHGKGRSNWNYPPHQCW